MLTGIICVCIVLLVLWSGWSTLALLELQGRMNYADYALACSYYNDLVMHLKDKKETTAEEEFSLAMLQDHLSKQASSLGLRFTPFQRPQSLSDPD